MPVTIEDIRAAAEAIRGSVVETPCIKSQTLSEIAGCELFLKLENLQYTASFKDRGALNRMLALDPAERNAGVVAMSAGNHAQSVAYHARRLGIPATIVMPATTPFVKIRNTEMLGAEVVLHGDTLDEASAQAHRLEASEGLVFVHPYDDDRVIAGQGTAALEFLEEIPDLDIICAPVSGGGLLSGTAIAAKSLRPEIVVIGCEPANADDAARSLASGQIEPSSEKFTIADGLRANLSPRTFAILRERVDRILLVTEEEIVQSMRLITEHLRSTVEPSGAVAASPALHRQIEGEDLRIGIILSGGNLDPDAVPGK